MLEERHLLSNRSGCIGLKYLRARGEFGEGEEYQLDTTAKIATSCAVSSAPPRILLLYRCYSSSFTAYPSILAGEGLMEVDVIAPSRHVIRQSVWVGEHFAANSDEAFLVVLCERLKSGAYQALFCIDEPSRELVLANAQLPELFDYLPFGSQSELNRAAVDKGAFYHWCARHSIPCPKSVCTQSASEVLGLAEEFEFPLVVKGARGAGGIEVDIVRSQQELEVVLNAHREREGWVLQEFIDGPVGTTTFVAREGRRYAIYSVVNRVCMRGGTGPSAICESIYDPRLAALADVMIRDGGVNGMTGFDWMLTPDGEYRVIDPHFGRAVPNAVAGHLSGVNWGHAFWASLVGKEPALVCAVDEPSYTVWLFPQALQLLFEPHFWKSFRTYSPFRADVKLFLCGRREWRLFLCQLAEHFLGRFRVLAGAFKGRMLGKRSGSRRGGRS
jgi:predicted ATP-grasp superfamily ATP-dependent carboligase